ncbi:hypothetical protein GCM10027063_40890 [Promicromonospora xylanilytica]
MNTLAFDAPRSWRGHWGIPGGETEYAGVLSYDPRDGLRLELVGILPSGRQIELPSGLVATVPDDGIFEVLVGVVDGRPITLLDCVSQRTQGVPFGSGSGGEQDLSVAFALFGIRLETADETAFDRVDSRIEGLTAWAGQSAITISSTRGKPDNVGMLLPDAQVAQVGDETYRIDHWALGFNPVHRADGTSVGVRHEAHLTIDAKAPAAWKELHTKAGQVVELVSLARRARAGFLSFRIRRAEKGTSRSAPAWVDVLWNQRVSAPNDGRVAFTSAEIGFQNLMVTWLARRTDLINATDLVQAVWDNGGYLESSVLAVATAVESLGSTYDLPRKMPDGEFKQLIAEVVAAAPLDQQGWLRGALSGMNGPSLRGKALAIANRLPKPVQDQLLPSPEIWARKLVRARNDLSHSGNTKATWEVLASLRQVTSAVIYLALLTELGLSDEQVGSALDTDPYLRYACRRAARDLGPVL